MRNFYLFMFDFQHKSKKSALITTVFLCMITLLNAQVNLIQPEVAMFETTIASGATSYVWTLDGNASPAVTIVPASGGLRVTVNSLGMSLGLHTLCVRANNACGLGPQQCLNFTVLQRPIAVDDYYSTPEDTPFSPTSPGVSNNDSDTDGPNPTWAYIPGSGPTHGTFTVPFSSTGLFTYLPDPNYIGIDSFDYVMCDNGSPNLCDTATVYINIGGVNDPPIAMPDYDVTLVNQPVSGNVLLNDDDLDFDPLFATTTAIVNPTNGTVTTLLANGNYTYTPNPGFVGLDSFKYRVCDPGNLCDMAWVYINVLPQVVTGNNPPVPGNDNAQTLVNTPVTNTLLPNDFDPDGDSITINTTPIVGSAHGLVIINPDGTFTYTPNTGFIGTDVFEYEICDDHGNCETAIATIEVYPNNTGNEAPFPGDDAYATNVNVPITGANISLNDTDPNGNPLVYTTAPFSLPTHGIVTISSTGIITYTPTANYVGNDQFVYTVCDNQGACDQATVNIIVLPPPVDAVDDINNTLVDTPVSGNILTNDTQGVIGATVTTTPITNVSNGTVVINANGTYLYTPDAGFAGTDVFTYSICNTYYCDTATVTINVIAPADGNNPPVASPDVVQTVENTPVSGDVTVNDIEPDGDPVRVDTIPFVNPTNGTVDLNPDGTFTYTPDPGFDGVDEFSYIICDNGGLCDTTTVTIDVMNNPGTSNLAPFAQDDAVNTPVNTPVTGDMSPNDFDPNGDALTYNTTPVNTPDNGTVVIDSNGTFTYTPNVNYVGPDQFVYTVCDSSGACDQATVYITVTPEAPTATPDFNNTLVDVPVTGNVLTNDEDPQNTPLTVTAFTQPANGTSSVLPNGDYTYTPDSAFVGQDTFEYTVCNEAGLCAQTTVIITVDGGNPDGNDPPIAADDYAQTFPSTPVSGDVTNNDIDVDGDEPLTTTVLDGPNDGTFVLNPDGTFTYTPDPAFVGNDTVTYIICDAGGACDTADVIIEVLLDPNGPANDAPFAQDDAATTNVNTPVDGDMSPNDSDPNSDPLVYGTTPVDGPTDGTVVIDSTGTFTYTPNDGFVGPDQFVYSVCDTSGLCDTATVYILVYPVGPDANNDIANTLPNTPVKGDLLTNDDNSTDTPLTINTTPVDSTANGTVVINPDGTYTYTPDPNFVGQDTFVYQVCNEFNLCDEAVVIINVDPNTPDSNDPPVASDDYAETLPNTPVSGDVTNNDIDIDGDAPLTTTVVDQPNNGTVVLNTDGTFTYTPDSAFVGNDTLTYSICDAAGACDTADVVITVSPDPNGPANDAPFAQDDAVATNVNTPVDGDMSPNDSDPNGDPLVYGTTPVDGPADGTVVIDSTGTFTYTPNDGFVGPDQFIYTVCDTFGLCDTATVYILVYPGAPDANDDIANTLPNVPVSGDLSTNDDNPVDGPLTYNTTPVDVPTNGTVVITPSGTYIYTPDPNFVGTDTFTYVVCNEYALCDTATVIINVDPNTPDSNDPPVAANDYGQTFPNTPVTGDVTNNDIDVDGEGPLTTTVLDQPNNGTVVLDSSGTFTYTPDQGFEGVDTITYVVCDVAGACDTADVIITVTPDPNGPANDAPFAQDDAVATDVNMPVSGDMSPNDSDPNADSLVYTTTPVDAPVNGTVTINPDGTFTYTPDNGFVGPDQFIYAVCDTFGLCDTATVYILVYPTAPDANDDIANTLPNVPVSGDLSTNDDNPVDGPLTYNTAPVDAPTNGTVAITPSGTYTYTPSPNFVGTDTFTYVVCNEYGLCDTATVIINVDPNTPDSNDPPVASNDYGQTFPGTPVTGDVTNNDIDVDGDGPLTTNVLDQPNNGTIVLNPNGTFTYTPNPTFEGVDTITYVVCDAAGACDTADVIITVTPNPNGSANDAPFAQDDAVATNVNTPVSGDMSPNDDDPNGDDLVYGTTPVDAPNNGTVVINPDGTFTYTPNTGYVGPDQFVYSVCDDGTPSQCDTATVYILVYPVGPDANDDIANTLPETPVSGNLLTNDDNPQDGPITINTTPADGPNNGTVVINPDGTFTYTPDSAFVGTDTFTYVICNEYGFCDTATVIINVDSNEPGTNDPVIAHDDQAETITNVPVTGDVTNNDIDVDGTGPLTVTVLDTTDHGTLVMNPNGTFTYTPDPNYTGPDMFTYIVCDQEGNCDTATVYITVNPNLPGNDAPYANDDANATNQDTPVSGTVVPNDFDPNGNPLTFGVVDTAQLNGTVVFNPNGTYTFTPDAGFTGPTSFTYVACDGGTPNLCDTATVIILVYPHNPSPPVAVDDNVVGSENDPSVIPVLDNDTYGTLAGPPTIVTPPAHGSVVFNPNDSTFVYTPTPNFCGVDSFQYEITTIDGLSDTAWVVIDVVCDEVVPFNGLSPNGDGKNDWFVIENIESRPENTVKIYNRWGNLVYEAKGYNNENVRFEGRWMNGDDLPDGTYYFVVKYTDKDNTEKTLGGYIELRR